MIDCARYFLFFFFFVFCLKLCFKMIAVSKRCWFDPNINSVCTEDHICTVSFYTTIAENKFCLHSLSNRNHFKTWNIYIRCSFVLFDGHWGLCDSFSFSNASLHCFLPFSKEFCKVYFPKPRTRNQ